MTGSAKWVDPDDAPELGSDWFDSATMKIAGTPLSRRVGAGSDAPRQTASRAASGRAMTNEAFFRQDGDVFHPNPISRGPWDPKSLNGRVVAGLLGCELERRHGEPGFLPARMTTDLYRLPGFDPIEVRTTVVRAGRRIRVVDADFISGGTSMARATCQFLALGENAAGEVWKPDPWEAPAPDDLPLDQRGPGMWETRPISGQFGQSGQRRIWLREIRECVDGVPLTPFQRVAGAADFASPWSHSGSEGLGYINTDVNLQLHRLPAGEWVGFESSYHDADTGIAVGQVRLYDEQGPIGIASCLALAQKMGLRPWEKAKA